MRVVIRYFHDVIVEDCLLDITSTAAVPNTALQVCKLFLFSFFFLVLTVLLK